MGEGTGPRVKPDDVRLIVRAEVRSAIADALRAAADALDPQVETPARVVDDRPMLLTLAQVGELFGKSYSWADDRTRDDEHPLPARKVGGSRMVSRVALDEWAAGRA